MWQPNTNNAYRLHLPRHTRYRRPHQPQRSFAITALTERADNRAHLELIVINGTDFATSG